VAVRATQYAFLAGVIVAVQLTAAHSLHSVVTVLHGHICPVTANTVIAVIMLPVMQLQKLEEITPVAILGVVLILLPLLLYLTQLPKHTATSDTGVPESSSLADIAAATTTLCFAYQGQTIFPELRSEMADPTTFPRAVVSATVLMTTTYLIVGVVGYMRLGPDAAYLNYWDNEHNPTAGRTVAANIMLILHVMTGFAAHRFSAPVMSCSLHLGGAPSFMLLAHCLRLIRHGGGLLGTLSTGT
jgi:amino acid permease